MLGDRIRKLRENAGLTQKELAVKLDMSASAIGMYEQNRRLPKNDMLLDICNLFNVKADYLLTGDEYEAMKLKARMKKNMMDFRYVSGDGQIRPVSEEDLDMLVKAIMNNDE